MSKIRFLPVMIFAAALMLTVRVGNIWNDVGGLLSGGVSVTPAAAQTPAGQPPAGQNAPPAPATPGAGAPPVDPLAKPLPAPVRDKQAIAARMLSDDPTLLTQSEIDLLQKLAARREALDKRAQEIQMRAGLLKAAEKRIDKKVTDFKILKSTIEGLIKKYDEQQTTKLQSLVKIYENMKPKDAARIFEKLDMDTLLLVAERMKERKLAPVMAKMNPDKAREVTVQLARLRNLPVPGRPPGG
ncbi:MotE family protein [Varunaivibrio sulfuroxidans]|uniref:Flagellar motility protein MotE (MotC chaperone) n=1 Tax=Varunaivibrio sulfuroxidans TaxID=1773489 RepID=A0A4V2UNZ1_9PROT|nr:hypothetical protein [Varunaivibrio sulfuroxidans]TCS63021.1 flagellar motility protein MotE (MotC chaperone) [Varunaivibrio sulfuroxidans]WES31903.1 hypothetical protein P3M64_05985 [Varunaivibrio sulfuroxidans]